MLKISSLHKHTLCILLVLMNGLLAAFPALSDSCGNGTAKSTTITFSETWRGLLTGNEEQWLRLPQSAQPAAAVVVLEVTRPLTQRIDVGEPLLTVCSHRRTKNGGFAKNVRVRVLGRSATHQVLRVDGPSDVTFRVTSQDPLRPAGPVKLTASFAVGVPAGQDTAQGVPVLRDTEEMEIEPELLILTCPVADDHADTSSCATPLAAPSDTTGVLANAWGDDSDVFSFVLPEERTVTIESHGTTDTLGGLLNASGQLLAVDDDGGTEKNFRLIGALLPGRYFIKVEGSAGAEGAYGLTLRATSW